MASRFTITEKQIAEGFARIEEELIASMIRNLERHQVAEIAEGFEWSMWQREQLRALEQYKRNNLSKYGKKFDELNKRVEEVIAQQYKGGYSKQERLIKQALSKGLVSDSSFFSANTDSLNALIRATHSDMMLAEYATLRQASDIYRNTIFHAQLYAQSGAGTYRQAIDMATKDFLAKGIDGIVYRNGSRHTIREYSQMAVRTSSKRALLVGEGDARKDWGVHTIVIDYRDDACPECMEWVGEVLIDDVYSGGSEKEAKEGGYRLLSEAMDAGLFHPNCRDTSSTWFEGISEMPERPSRSAQEAAEAREELEQVENTAKNNEARYERLSEFSLDPANKEKYAAKAEEWGERLDNLELA